MSASPATTSSRAFATTCGPATRPVRAWTRSFSHQIPLMEEALVSDGRSRWAMVEHEADDALGAAAAVADADPRVKQVMIVTPDKDLASASAAPGSSQFDRRKGEIIDEAAVHREVRRRAGVDRRLSGTRRRYGRRLPGPGRLGRQERRHGARQVRPHRGHPAVGRRLGLPGLRGAEKLAVTLRDQLELALLFRRIATVEARRRGGHGRRMALDRSDSDGFAAIADRLGAPQLVGRAERAGSAPRADPPTEVTARRPAAHERYR